MDVVEADNEVALPGQGLRVFPRDTIELECREPGLVRDECAQVVRVDLDRTRVTRFRPDVDINRRPCAGDNRFPTYRKQEEFTDCGRQRFSGASTRAGF